MLLLTIPYEKGWTAYDNGKKIPIIQSNYMYTGLLLNPGNHQIKLIYHTPGLTTGWMLTIVGWIIFLFTIILKNDFLLNNSRNLGLFPKDTSGTPFVRNKGL